MREPDWKIRFLDMIASLDAISSYTQSLTSQEFSGQSLVIDATLRHLTVIGEAADKIPDEIKVLYSTVPWRQIKSMRNRLVHDYRGIDLDIVWQTVQNDLPALRHSLAKIINQST